MGHIFLILGVAFLVAEIFLPSGAFGVIGFCMFVTGVFRITGSIYFTMLAVVLAVAVLFIILLFIAGSLPKTNLYKTLLLNTKLGSKEGVLASKENDTHIGEIMQVDTFLRPSGRIKKDGKVYDALSDSEFIEKGEFVEVVGNRGYILLVKRAENTSDKNEI